MTKASVFVFYVFLSGSLALDCTESNCPSQASGDDRALLQHKRVDQDGTIAMEVKPQVQVNMTTTTPGWRVKCTNCKCSGTQNWYNLGFAGPSPDDCVNRANQKYFCGGNAVLSPRRPPLGKYSCCCRLPSCARTSWASGWFVYEKITTTTTTTTTTYYSERRYADMGVGWCQTADGQKPSKSTYRPNGGSTCEQECSNSAACYGYSVSSTNNCLLWEESGLIGGGSEWGGAHCHIKEKRCWSARIDGYFVVEGMRSTECYDFETAKTQCEQAPDCYAITTQNNKCGGKYRVTHGGPRLWYDFRWNKFDVWSYKLTSKTCRQAYADMGVGWCQTADGQKPSSIYRPNAGSTCKQECSNIAACYGYSVSSTNNCLLWKESGLIGGGSEWGGAHCHIKETTTTTTAAPTTTTSTTTTTTTTTTQASCRQFPCPLARPVNKSFLGKDDVLCGAKCTPAICCDFKASCGGIKPPHPSPKPGFVCPAHKPYLKPGFVCPAGAGSCYSRLCCADECNWDCYVERYPHVASYEQGPQAHYENLGKAEGRTCTCPPPDCNWSCYIQRYKGVADYAKGDLSKAQYHFENFGAGEGKVCRCPR